MKKMKILSPALLALILAGCGGKSDKEDVATNYCPTPLTVQDASHLTRFKDGPGRDPRDIVFEADIGNASVTCSVAKNQLQVDMVVRVAATAGPSVVQGQTRVPYFVRVISPSGSKPSDLGGYRVAVGLKPTQEELDFNRRAVAR